MKLPVTRYYGSKRRIVEKIGAALQEHHIEFNSILDLFGGTGIVSYYMAKIGKEVVYNDILSCLNQNNNHRSAKFYFGSFRLAAHDAKYY